MTHNNPQTAPLLGLYLGRIRREQVVDVTRAIAILQKEHGERGDRKQARWKYTIRRLGVDAVRTELKARFGIALEDAEPRAASADAPAPRLAPPARRQELVRALGRERPPEGARARRRCARRSRRSASP